MRTSTRSESGKRAGSAAHRKFDIAGIACIGLGAIVAVALAIGDAGLIGQSLAEGLRQLFGGGTWAIAAALVILGIGLIFRRTKFEAAQLGIGLLLLFLVVVGAMARSVGGDYFDPATASESGGLVGGLIGWSFEKLLGSAKPIGLGCIGMIGLILSVQMPIHSIYEMTANRARQMRSKTKRAQGQAVVRMPDSPSKKRILERTPLAEVQQELAEDKPRRREPVIRDLAEAPAFASSDSTPKEGYKLPPMTLLNAPAERPKRTPQEMQNYIETLESTLEEFGIEANVVEVATGPTITRYECQLGPGIKVSRIKALADNIAMNMTASHVRVEAPIPGKAAIGVEVPNAKRITVTLRETCDTPEFKNSPARLHVCLGQDVSGLNQYADLTRMPHLLIGGATNSGKSIGLATVIMSLLMRNTPKDLKFVMIDPKRVELTLFDRIPHLLCPVVTDMREAPAVLRAVWREMDRRYDILNKEKVRNIEGWNERASFQEKMPYIVVIIDELADLMIAAKAEVETTVVRLAQLARAVGIHLVIATQRPSVDVITGTIKANIPSRIAFAVSSLVDSRTILDEKGAEDLIGRGDMLYAPIDANKPTRIQGCYVSEEEIERVCDFWREQEPPAYALDPAELVREHGGGSESSARGDLDDADELYQDAVLFAAERGQVSTSMLQRRFAIGFQRASRLIDVMEERGIVGQRDGPRPREVLVNIVEAEEMFGVSN